LFDERNGLKRWAMKTVEIVERYAPSQGNLKNLQFANPRVGWAIAHGQVLVTSDGGHSWNNRLPNSFQNELLVPQALFAIDSNRCWLLTTYASWEVRCFCTTDRGQSWTENARFFSQKQSIVSEGVFFTDELHGWVLLSEGRRRRFRSVVYRTEDGGQQWVAMPFTASGRLQKMVFADRLTGWIVEIQSGRLGGRGRTVLHFTCDGGRSWDERSVLPGRVRDIFVLNRNELFCSGSNGMLARSKDSGKTWTIERSHTRLTLETIHFRWPVGVAAGTADLIRSRRSLAFLVTRSEGREWERAELPFREYIMSVYLTSWDGGVISTAESLYLFRLCGW
jgi:hypothetical protein